MNNYHSGVLSKVPNSFRLSSDCQQQTYINDEAVAISLFVYQTAEKLEEIVENTEVWTYLGQDVEFS